MSLTKKIHDGENDIDNDRDNNQTDIQPIYLITT